MAKEIRSLVHALNWVDREYGFCVKHPNKKANLGLKPRSMVAFDAWAKAQAHLRDKCKSK
jgi:hypothetical protein